MSEATSKRRLVRYSLRTLLVLPVFFAAAWWWVTWPERTARKFVRLLNEDPNAAKEMIDGPQASLGFWKVATSPQFSFESQSLSPGSWANFLAARRTFDVEWQAQNSDGDLGRFIAVRNHVMLDPTVSDGRYLISYAVKPDRAVMLAEQLAQYYPAEKGIRVDPKKNMVLIGVPERVHGEIRPLLLLLEMEPSPQ
jgi:hypothetical protein